MQYGNLEGLPNLESIDCTNCIFPMQYKEDFSVFAYNQFEIFSLLCGRNVQITSRSCNGLPHIQVPHFHWFDPCNLAKSIAHSKKFTHLVCTLL